MIDFAAVYDLFFSPGDVVEIRALGLNGKSPSWDGWVGGSGTVFGLFDNRETFAKAGTALESLSGAVYFTANPCKPQLLARGVNRLLAQDKKRPCASDVDIAVIRWLLIDLDPKRPTGISSSNLELGAAAEVAKAVTTYLEGELGFPLGIRAMSGNGYHLMYRLPDLENCEFISGRQGLVSLSLAALSARFSNAQVDVDQVVFNPSRIWKLYGTMARKGDSTEALPHRRSFLFKNQVAKLNEIACVTLEQLTALADLAPPRTTPHARLLAPPAKKAGGQVTQLSAGTVTPMASSLGPLKIGSYLDHYGRNYRKKEKGASTWYCLDVCLFDETHRDGEAAIIFSPQPPYLTYHCFHNSCRDRTWKDAKARISGAASLASFCENYDPDWRPQEGDSRAMAPAGTGCLAEVDIAKGFLIGARRVVMPNQHEVDADEFFVIRGKREVFNVVFATRYAVALLDPIVHTQKQFWVFRDGVWVEEDDEEVQKVVGYALGDRMQPAWMKNVCECVAALRNQRGEVWECPETMVNITNGMLDVESFTLREHDPLYWSRSQLPVAYDPAATAPLWEKTIDMIMMGVESKSMQLQEFFGYCLLPTCRMEKALFMFGTGSNGKSTVLTVLEKVLIGTNNTSVLNLEAMNKPFSILDLQGKMINISSEIESKERASTENLKKAISGDLLHGEHKHGKIVRFRSYAKFIFAMNSPPIITDRAFGFARKILVLNFNRRFDDANKDKYLAEKLAEEASGILNWAIIGAKRLLDQGGFTEQEGEGSETQAFLTALSPTLQYAKESVQAQEGAMITTQALYENYCEWCDKSGSKRLTRQNFASQIITNFSKVAERRCTEVEALRLGGKRVLTLYGIRIQSDDPYLA